ncbi:nitroreductase family protein [Arcobacter sp. FWKO B]|uniref:nitroreductase family protein n=1 Tax=Arcobacter sp. FWKO B TaxID=2593672 RepID=UPI00190674F0|nr:nitroreductase family protein [Arcobacter sp. FWKO B]
MTFDDLKDLMQKNRCYRVFDASYEIPQSDLVDLIEIARISSSARNTQPLRYKIVDKNPLKTEIFKPLRWAANLSWDGPSLEEMPTAFIIVCKDVNLGEFAMVDAGIAMANIMLAIKAKGLDGCMLASIDKQKYKELLNLDDTIEPMFAIALGKAKQNVILKDDIQTTYYKDELGNHIVPKLPLKKVLL